MRNVPLFDESDVELLLHALDIWVEKGRAELMVGMFTAIAVGDLDKEEISEQLEKAKAKQLEKEAKRKERAIDLQAKLYVFRKFVRDVQSEEKPSPVDRN